MIKKLLGIYIRYKLVRDYMRKFMCSYGIEYDTEYIHLMTTFVISGRHYNTDENQEIDHKE